MKLIVVIVLVLLSGLFSGLTLGLLGLEKDELKRKADLGDQRAQRIYQIRKDGNLLLTTLLIGNVAVNSALSIFLGSLTNGFLAGLIATSLIVIFGEITPQAVFNRYRLILGSFFVPFVKTVTFLIYPIAKPIASLLDKILGQELPTIYSKEELIKLIEYHEDHPASEIDSDEERILKGALSFSGKTVYQIMTPKNVVFMLSEDTVIDEKILSLIKEKSFSRIPVYSQEKDNLVGILYLKDLIGVNLPKKVKEMMRTEVLFLKPETNLDFAFNQMLKEKVHLAFVVNEFGNFEGIITLEDILEEIILTEIVDEDDKVIDLREEAKKKVKIKRWV